MREVCSCSAKFEITDTEQWSTEALLETFKEWRETHRHEFAPELEEGPLIHESVSSHERMGDEYPVADRAPAGFAR